MPAVAKYPTAAEQLRELCELGRRDGLDFRRVWQLAMRPGEPPVTWHTPERERPARCIVWPRDTTDRRLSIRALVDSRDGWRRAYDGAPPTGPEKALRLLAPLLERIVEVTGGLEHVPDGLPPEQLTLLG